MTRTTEIPGLIGVFEEPLSDGGSRLIFEVEDGKEGQFLSAFGLKPDDSDGFGRVMLEALERVLETMGRKDD